MTNEMYSQNDCIAVRVPALMPLFAPKFPSISPQMLSLSRLTGAGETRADSCVRKDGCQSNLNLGIIQRPSNAARQVP